MDRRGFLKGLATVPLGLGVAAALPITKNLTATEVLRRQRQAVKTLTHHLNYSGNRLITPEEFSQDALAILRIELEKFNAKA